MTKYRNPRKEQENLETEEMEHEMELMKTPATTVEEETWKRRYADLRRHQTQSQDQTRREVDELRKQLDMALKGQIKAPKSDEEIDSWMKEYPDFAQILETIVRKRIAEATSTTQQKLEELELKEKELDREKAVAKLRKAHPDFETLVKDKDFHEWLANQSERDQDSIYRSLNVDDASFVISKYKAHKKIPNKSQGDDEDCDMNEAAKVVKTSSSLEPIDDFGDYDFSESQIERESKKNRKWYDQNEEKIMTALRKGRVLMDISGGAR
jgi:hypothetical protein